MCGYNTKEKVLLSLSEYFDVKSSTVQYGDTITCFVVFDILYLNDEVLTNKPLRERIECLKKCFNEVEGRFVYSQRELAHKNIQVVEALNKAIDTRLEGIVVKDCDSVYKPSVRSNSGWFKVKPDYMLGLNDDLDVLIVGGYYGEGKLRAGLISHFLVGVSVKPKDSNTEPAVKSSSELNISDELDLEGNDEIADSSAKNANIAYPTLFYSFSKIGAGYTMKELYNFTQKLTDKWKPFDKKKPPKHFECTYERPDVWIEPKDSIIVQVSRIFSHIYTNNALNYGLT
jgi:DNA ligase-4